MPAARYWRIFATQTDKVNLPSFGRGPAIATLELRETIDGANVATGGTPSASSQYPGGFDADKAFDGNINTFWGANSTTTAPYGEWISYDFGIGNTRDIVQIAVTTRNDAFFADGPSDAIIQYSTDNTNWIDLWRVHDIAFTVAGQTRTWTKPGAFAPTVHWALRVGRNTGQVAIGGAKLELIETAGGADISSTRLAERAFSTFNGNTVPGNLFDNNNSGPTHTYSSRGPGDFNDTVFIGVTFSSVKVLNQIKWYSRNDGDFGQAPTRFWMEWSPDGTNYNTYWQTTTPATWTQFETRTLTRPGPEAESVVGLRRMRLLSAGSVSIPAEAQAVVRLNRLTALATARRRLPGTVITAVNLVSATRRLIQDTLAPQRFTDVVLIDYMNMILSLLCIYRPDVFSKVVQVAPAADSVVQTLPPDAVRLVEVFSVAADPQYEYPPGSAITEVTRETMDQMYPQWVGEPSGIPVNFMRHPRNPRSYYLYPPPASGTVLNIEYIRALPIYGIANDIPLSQDMFSVIVAGMVFLAEVSDAEPSSFDRAKVALVQFVQDVGSSLNVRVIADTESAAVRTDGDEDVKTRK